MTTAPRDEEELLRRVRALAGRRLGDVAAAAGLAGPGDARRAKGWAGVLVEVILGADAGSRAAPDFRQIGVEMKTIPVDARGRPQESTFVCTASFDGVPPTWEQSWAREKLSRVLWVPLVDGGGGPADRLIGSAFLWTPSPEEDATLAADWAALSELLVLGETWLLHARHGTALQLRPKGASAEDRAWLLGEDLDWVRDMKRGFYLRTSFTSAIVARALHLPT